MVVKKTKDSNFFKKMVKKYPTTIEELKQRREAVPKSEVKFFELVNVLSDDWYVWHSVKWDYDTKKGSGEADFLLFNARYGFIVVEVKGGLISVENGIFYSTNQITYEKKVVKDPFAQAERSMHCIREFYVEKAKQQPNPSELLKKGLIFPLNFDYGVFFPDSPFKSDFESIQYRFVRIYDSIDYENHLDWVKKNDSGPSTLETFLVSLLETYKYLRVNVPRIGEFFPQLIGSNISKYICLKKYFDLREIELERANQVQDYLLAALSKKIKCAFKGSAGSGKTFIAMKKALLNYAQGLKTLFLCFNVELREFVKDHLSKKLGEPSWKLESKIDVCSIRLFLSKLVKNIFDEDKGREIMEKFKSGFSYKKIADELRKNVEKIPDQFKYDAIIIDEAQDFDENLWDLFVFFLRRPEESIFYVFYDDGQAIFVKNFSPKRFGLDEKSDLIVLNRNLRNSIEIAHWIENRTKLGHYEEYSGINGFEIKQRNFSNRKEAILRTILVIKKGYFAKNVESERIIILSYNKLAKFISPLKSDNDLGDYVMLKKSSPTEKDIILIEPKKLSDLHDLKRRERIDRIITFKTITSFKGLERDVVFLLIPNFDDFKKAHPELYDNFLMQVYVGASRAKFKLDIVEYNLSG